MGSKRDYIAEIEEIRGRSGPADWDNGITKLLFLSSEAQKLEKEAEQHAYFIVASIAAIEVYLRWEIRRLIDFGEARYTENFRLDETSLKLSHDLLIAVHGKRVTIGELAAHSVRLHNLEAIDKTMTKLLGTGFLDLVKGAREPDSDQGQGEDARSVIHSIAETLANVKRAFTVRHIICHEAHLSTMIRTDEVRALCSSCYEFARASYYAIAHYDDPAAPRTLEEAYDAARLRVEVLENRLREAEEQIMLGLSPMEKAAFGEMQRSWKAYALQEGEYNASLHMNGNRGMVYEKLVVGALYQRRLEEIGDIGKWEGRRW